MEFIVPIFLTIVVLAMALDYRWFSHRFALLFCSPFLVTLLALKFAIQVSSWLTGKQIAEGRYTIWLKINTKATYWAFLTIDTFVEEFNRIISILTGEDSMAIQIERPGTPQVFVPSCEDEDDPKALRVSMTKLDATRRAKIRDGVVGLRKGRVSKFRSNTVALQLVLESMSGVENLMDGDDQIEFDQEHPINTFNLFPVEIQEELLEEYGSTADADEEEDEDMDLDEDDEDIFA